MPSLTRLTDGVKRQFGGSLSPDDAYLSCELLVGVRMPPRLTLWQTTTCGVSSRPGVCLLDDIEGVLLICRSDQGRCG